MTGARIAHPLNSLVGGMRILQTSNAAGKEPGGAM